MTAPTALPADLEPVVAFHGHLCPGLVIGYRAVLTAVAALGVERAPDEDLVLLAENDSCSVDAFQSMLSTTFGKGNLRFLDNGKQVFTLFDRGSGRAVRVSFRYDAMDGVAEDRAARIAHLLAAPADDLFHVNMVEIQAPPMAPRLPTSRCARCQEGAMGTRTVVSDDQVYCLPCARDLGLVTDGRLDPRGPLVQ
jgi:formylmethanofuran dehydrogenase subunit E